MEKTDRPEGEMWWDPDGDNDLLMIGDKYVGHFYIDASDEVDADAILEKMVELWNAWRESL
jgi:hypothetical protein